MTWRIAAYVAAAVVLTVVVATRRAARRRRSTTRVERQVDDLRRRGARAAVCDLCAGAGRLDSRQVCPRCHGLGYVHDLPDDEVFKA